MTATHERRARLSIDVEPELRKRIKIAAAERELSIRDYVVNLLRQAVAEDEQTRSRETADWARLSARSFARDWVSKEDEAYDSLS
ncbi:MAG: hypothetical protein HYY05_08185 [Chloroflexi bacterium]|nr:hypothetical protein [Chloroflexota bacterium]